MLKIFFTLILFSSKFVLAGDVVNLRSGERLEARCLELIEGHCRKIEITHLQGGVIIKKAQFHLSLVNDPNKLFLLNENKATFKHFPVTTLIGEELAGVGAFIGMFGLTVVNLAEGLAMGFGAGATVVTPIVVITGASIAALPPVLDIGSYPVRKIIQKIRQRQATRHEIMAADGLKVLLDEKQNDLMVDRKNFNRINYILFNTINDGKSGACTIESEKNGAFTVKSIEKPRTLKTLEGAIKKVMKLTKRGACNPILPKCEVIERNGIFFIRMNGLSPFYTTDSKSQFDAFSKKIGNVICEI